MHITQRILKHTKLYATYKSIQIINFEKTRSSLIFSMAAGCKLRLSANICIFLCIYVSFVNYKSFYLQKSTFLNDSDVYFVSKVSCRTEIAGNLRQQRNPSGDKEFSNSLKAVMLCKLFHRACFALALIALAAISSLTPATRR